MKKQHYISSRQGAVMPLLAFVISAILLVVALSINTNWFLYSRINAQNAADISARSSLGKLIGDTEADGRVLRARNLGARLYDLNLDRPDVALDPNRVKFGNIVDRSALEPEFIEEGRDDDSISAVFVDTPTSQQEVDVFFANMLGGPDRVRIVADAVVSTRNVDIMLCLDGSRSMNRTSNSEKGLPPGGTSIHEPPLPGSRWFELVDTVAVFLDAMRETNPGSRVGLTTFGGGYSSGTLTHTAKASPLDETWARVEQGLTIASSRSQVQNIVDTLESYSDLPALGLGTSLYDGIEMSVEALSRNPANSRHIIMLSDGQQAVQGERPSPLNAARAAADEGITVHTISFGGNIKQMDDIANETGGANFTAKSEEELREAFAQLLGRFRVQLVD